MARRPQNTPNSIHTIPVSFEVPPAIGIGMSFIPSEGDQLIREAGKTVLALASSAGGALIGVLAPKPSAG